MCAHGSGTLAAHSDSGTTSPDRTRRVAGGLAAQEGSRASKRAGEQVGRQAGRRTFPPNLLAVREPRLAFLDEGRHTLRLVVKPEPGVEQPPLERHTLRERTLECGINSLRRRIQHG